jgi:DNA-binding NarL/FixJ family response regulator
MKRALPLAAPAVFFSPRERQYMELAVQGKSNKEIAFALQIAVSTAKDIASRVYSKAGVKDCREFLVWGITHPEDVRLGITRDPGLPAAA